MRARHSRNGEFMKCEAQGPDEVNVLEIDATPTHMRDAPCVNL